MAGKGSSAPESVAAGLQQIGAAIQATMMAPDAAPHLALLEQLLKAVVGAAQQGHGAPGGAKPPGAPPGGAPPGPGGPGGPPSGPPPGGGTNIGQLMGGGAQGPSAEVSGQGPTQSGISADDLRRAMAAQADQG